MCRYSILKCNVMLQHIRWFSSAMLAAIAGSNNKVRICLDSLHGADSDSLRDTWHVRFFCLTNHTFSVTKDSEESTRVKSNILTSSGIRTEISSRLMFLPMHVLDPAPNCFTDSDYQPFPSKRDVSLELTVMIYRFMSDVRSADSSQRSGRKTWASGPKICLFACATQLLTPTSVYFHVNYAVDNERYDRGQSGAYPLWKKS